MTIAPPVPRNYRLTLGGAARFVWECPFWLMLALSAFLPASLVPRGEWFGVPLRATDLLTVLIALLYGALGCLARLLASNPPRQTPMLPATLALAFYGLLRLWTGPLEQEDQVGMTFALLLFVAGPLQAVGLLSLYHPAQTANFLKRLALFLAFVSVVYTAESVLGLGLRSEEGSSIYNDFGIQRVRGPLFGSSTGYLVLLPALGWTFCLIFQSAWSKTLALFSAASLLGAYLGLGSRAGLILLSMFLTGLFIEGRKLKKSSITLFFAALLCVGIAVVIYSQADTQRFSSFEDRHRQLTHQAAWNVATTEPPLQLLAGQGFGTIWPWYRRDILNTDRIARGDNMILTGFGPSLYHAHSTFLVLGVEFGLAGVVWFLFLTYRLGRSLLQRGATPGWRVFSLALAISLVSFAFDLFLFKEVRVSNIWWIFVAALYQLHPREALHVR
jgi:O-antigen ligase